MHIRRKLFRSKFRVFFVSALALAMGLVYMIACFVVVRTFSPAACTEAWCKDDDWKIGIASDIRKRRIAQICRGLTADPNFKPKLSWDFFARQRPKSKLYGDSHPNEVWWNNFIVSDKYKALFCEIPKSGSSNIKYYFFNLAANQTAYNYTRSLMAKIHREISLTKLPHLYNFDFIETLQEAKSKYDNYFKFVFYRDPLARLISAWRFFFSRQLQGPFVDVTIDVIRAVRPGAAGLSATEIVRSEPMLLVEFLQYLEMQNDSATFNEHWRPQIQLSNPCEIKYDFIGVADATMSESIEYLARRLSQQQNVPKMPLGDQPTEVVEHLQSVPKHLINRVLLKHYSLDYLILDFPFPGP